MPWGTLNPCVYLSSGPSCLGLGACCWVLGVADLKVNLWQAHWER